MSERLGHHGCGGDGPWRYQLPQGVSSTALPLTGNSQPLILGAFDVAAFTMWFLVTSVLAILSNRRPYKATQIELHP
jgi:hypothetical protein